MIGIQYNARLQRLVKQIRNDINEVLVPVIKQLSSQYVQDSPQPSITKDAWPDIIQSLLSLLVGRWQSPRVDAAANLIAREFVQSSLKKSERDLKRSAGIDVFSGSSQMQDYLHASSLQNAQLIKSIPAKYLEEVQTLVMANMRAGMRPSYIEKALSEQFGVTQRRARLIARDQTSKIQGELTMRQQQNSGIKYFRWLTSHDQRVRHSHDVLGDKVTKYGKGVYSWTDLPLEKGEPVFPGKPINCRCTAVPVLESQVKRNQDQGNTDPSVSR